MTNKCVPQLVTRYLVGNDNIEPMQSKYQPLPHLHLEYQGVIKKSLGWKGVWENMYGNNMWTRPKDAGKDSAYPPAEGENTCPYRREYMQE